MPLQLMSTKGYLWLSAGCGASWLFWGICKEQQQEKYRKQHTSYMNDQYLNEISQEEAIRYLERKI